MHRDRLAGHRITPPLAVLCLLAVGWGGALPTVADAAAPGWRDAGFDRVGAPRGPWEIRFGAKTDEPATRPRWAVQRRTHEAPATGSYLSLEPVDRAAGTVYVGQTWRVPARSEGLCLSVRYQTYCPLEDRSGLLRFDLFSPAAWARLAADPEQAGAAPSGDLLSHEFKGSGDDVTQWTTASWNAAPLDAVLRAQAGRDIVVAVAWTTWHSASLEWAKLDDLQVGPAPPSIQPRLWPQGVFPAEPVDLRVLATGEGTLDLSVTVTPTGADGRQALSLRPRPERGGRYVATVPADFVTGPFRVRASLRSGGQVYETPEQRVSLAVRPSYPGLYYTPEILAAMRAKRERFDWARRLYEATRRNAAAWLHRPIAPPTEGGGWYHNYTCPEDGSHLSFREDHPHDHLCPTCRKTWQGAVYDAVWRGGMHSRYIDAARDLALIYQLDGERAYGRRAVAILDWYAQRYLDLPLGPGPAGRGKVQAQSLSECTWLIDVMNAVDLAHDAMTPAEARRIETQLVRAGAEHIHGYTFGIHNIQCWHNACYAAAGYLLGDAAMVAEARDGKLGFTRQIEKGILADGLWYERSLGYHSYTLSAIIAHCEVARNHGDALDRLGRVPQMFTAPLQLAFPNLVPPSLNDMGYQRTPLSTRALEMAVAWYGDEQAAAALNRRLADGANRRQMLVWKYGGALRETGPYRSPPSVDLPGAGLAVLRRGQGDAALCAMLEYGEHGGGHGHPDKLQLLLYGLGRPLCPDLGTTGYGNPMHGRYYKTTPGHNTVTIGGRSMAHVAGRLLDFQRGATADSAVVACETAYPGYALTRRVLLTDDVAVDVFDVTGRSPEFLDWFLRAPGRLSVDLPLRPTREEPLSAAYTYLDDLRAATTEDSWTAAWAIPDADGGRLQLTVAPVPGTQVGAAAAPGPAGRQWPTLRIRRRAATTRFAVVYQFLPAGAHSRPVHFEPAGLRVGELRVQVPDAPAGLIPLR